MFSELVRNLLVSGGKAAVPGLGTFIAEERPSVFSDRGFTINPPYCSVSFVNDTDGDKSFVLLYAGSEGIGEREAWNRVSEFVAGIRERLASEREVYFPGLGRLKVTVQNMLLFVQDEGVDIYPGLDCLEPISLKSLDTVSRTGGDVRVARPEMTRRTPAARDRTLRRVGRVLAAVLLSVAAILAILAVVGRIYPEVVDPLLYSQEQLEILYPVYD